MSRWFRIYDEALDDHKVQSLSPELFKTWFNLLCVASRENGVIPPVEKLAFALRVSITDMQARLDELVLLGLLDIRSDRKIEPHNWAKRQWKSDDSKDRVRKHRHAKRHCNDDVTVTVTPPESEPDTETDTENKLQLSSLEAAREVKSELGFKLGFNNRVRTGKRDGMETLLRQAEGLGLDVDDLVGTTNRNRPNNREGYFVTLCVNQLKGRLPGLDDQIIRDALNGKHEQYKTVCALLMGVTP